MSSLGSLVVKLALEMAGYKSGLNEAAAETEKAAGRMERAGEQVRGTSATVKGAMNGNAEAALQVARAVGVGGVAFTAAAAAAGAAAYAYYQGAQEAHTFTRAMILTGNAAGMNAQLMHQMAAGIDTVVGTHAQAAAALTAMASTGKVARGDLQGFTQVAIEMERIVGTSVADTAKTFAELGAEPVKASLKLNDSLNYLTAATFEQIKAAQEMGDHEKAASLAQDAYADAMHNRTERIKADLGVLEKAWMGVKDVAKETWDSMLGIGRPTSVASKLADETNLLERMKNGSAGGKFGQAGIDRQQEIVTGLSKQLLMQDKVAQAEADHVATQKAKIGWLQEGDKYLTKELKLQQEIAQIKKSGAAAGMDEEAINKRVKLAEERAATKAKVDNSAQRELEKEAALLATLSGVNADYLQELDRLGRMREKGNKSEAEYIQLVEQLIAKQPMAKALMDANAKETERQEKATLAAGAAHWKYLESLQKGVTTLQEEAQKQAEHNEKLGLGKVAVAELDAIKLESKATTLDLMAIKELDKNLDESQYALYKMQAEELRKIAKLKRDGALKEESIDAAKAGAEEWKKGLDETLRLGREVWADFTTQGENASQKIARTLGKTVSSALFDVFAKPFLVQVYTSIAGGAPGGALGAVNSAGGLLGGSGSSGLPSTFSALGGNLASGFKAGLGAVFGESGTLGGLSAGTTALGAGNVLGGLGTLAGTVMPWLAGASLLQSLSSYTVDAKGNYLLANASGSGLSGQVARRDDYQQNSSGIFSGGTTQNSDWSRAGESIDAYFDAAIKSSTSAARQYAAALGLPVEALDGYAKQIEVSITGLDAAGQKAAIDKAIGTFMSDMVSSAYGGALNGLAREGETSAQTLQRVATNLVAVNDALGLLGGTAMTAGAAGAKAASTLVDAFGGVDKMGQTVGAYYNAFYTDAERAAQSAATLGDQFAALGVQMPSTKQEFRALVDSIDITTNSGAKLAASVLGLAPAFDAAAQSAAAAANNLLAAAKNWGTSDDVRSIQAQILQRNLADSGLSVDIGTILGATKDSVLAYYKTLDPNSAAAQALLKYQQDIYDFVMRGGRGGATALGNDNSGYSGLGGSDSALSQWESATQAIKDTMRDLRTTLIDTGTDSFERLQAQFAIEIAQAKAGSLAAAQDLPNLAKALASSGERRGLSSVERAVLSGRILEALGGVVGIPRFDVGTNSVPQDMLAVVHKGGRITPAAWNPTAAERGAALGGTDAQTVELLASIDRRLAVLVGHAGDTATASRDTFKNLDLVVNGRRPIRTQAVTA